MANWGIQQVKPQKGRGIVRKLASSGFLTTPAGEPQIKLLFEWVRNSYRTYLVLRYPFDVAKCEIFAGQGARETLELNFNYLLDEHNVRYVISDRCLALLRAHPEITLTLTGVDGAEFSYRITRQNLPEQLRKLVPGVRLSNFLLAAGAVTVLVAGIYFLGDYLARTLPPDLFKDSPAREVTIEPVTPESVSRELYRYALNCRKIEFSLGEFGSPERFGAEVVTLMQNDLAQCAPAVPEILTRCEHYDCARDYVDVDEYSSEELAQLYQEGRRLGDELKIFAPVSPEIASAVTVTEVVVSENPRAITGAVQAPDSVSELEGEILGSLINDSAPAVPPVKDSRRAAWQKQKPVRGTLAPAPARKSPPAARDFWNEIDHGAAIQLGFSCQGREAQWEIVFARQHNVPPGAEWMLELTWPDNETTAHVTRALDAQRLVLQPGRGKFRSKNFTPSPWIALCAY